MKKITVNLKNKPYKILLEQNILKEAGKHIHKLNVGKKILIITQDRIPKDFIHKLTASLQKSCFKVFYLVLPSGENIKNITYLLKIIKSAVKNKFERNDSFCALGGGVVSDLSGLAASIYLRGINFISIPTTLLGMVDASIGGKTAVNIKEGKNLLGTFYQPKIILIDPCFLKTLTKKELLIGMAEVIKYALLEKTAKKEFSQKGFFNFLMHNKNNILNLKTNVLLKIIEHSVSVKARIVSIDEKESSLRAILNLGHTFAHGIEQAYDYSKYTHGEAVSIGICFACKLAEKQKLISNNISSSIINLISDYGLPTKLESNQKLTKITSAMVHDKKIKNGKLRLILPWKTIGKVKVLSNISIKEIKHLLKNY